MPSEPELKRVAVFIDGQNLFHAVREAFGYTYPNYDPVALSKYVCSRGQGWSLEATHFYTGVPAAADNPRWNHFWVAKLAMMGTRGVRTFSRPLRYRNQTVVVRGMTSTFLVGQEKGIDVRIALDVVRLAREGRYDVALLFTQDQDLSEVADEVRAISREHGRWIGVACAFPLSPTSRNRRGVNKTDWIPLDRASYDRCLDPHDYRQRF